MNTPKKLPLRRCALYTRKSTEEGLEQQFNSLDAQREACAAYVLSQKAEGWRALPELYDDGGYSGGSMDRPGLQRLLADIKAGLIDVVVVYKIDRLTRSLTDFARMVEVFDRQGVSFVSVTQAFNTTNSMGRLTLNVLLSFAQFEREVIGERVRDKIAASKRKGMWMGGSVPLGYDRPADGHRALIINEDEARIVRHIFESYARLGSVNALCRELSAEGLRTKLTTTEKGHVRGGVPFSRGMLFHFLRNRLYLGDIHHKGQHHKGLHPAIISQDLFDRVQAKLDAQRRRGPAAHARKVAPAPLTGKIFDADGHPMSPTFSYSASKRIYRYYVSSPLQTGHGDPLSPATPRRVSAAVLERHLFAALPDATGRVWPDPRQLYHDIQRIDILSDRCEVRVLAAQAGSDHSNTNINNGVWDEDRQTEGTITRVTLPLVLSTHSGKTIIVRGRKPLKGPDPTLVSALRRAHTLIGQDEEGGPSLDAAPKSPHQQRLIRLAFLAPDIQQAILDGRQPEGLTLTAILEGDVPLLWSEQRAWIATLASSN